MRRRPVNVFGLSFLDVMFCGFGSVILLVMLVNADAIERRKEIHTDLRGEIQRLERKVLEGEQYLVVVSETLETTRSERTRVDTEATRVSQKIARVRVALAERAEDASTRAATVETLKSTLKAMEQQTAALAANQSTELERGTNVRAFVGQGDRQYLTGLKMGGSRILILLDASASMLDETIVNVIRRRNLSESARRESPKWRQALATVEWLASNLPPTSEVQIFTFNTVLNEALTGTAPRWLKANDRESLNKAIDALYKVVPQDGTSLHRAFAAVSALGSRPDNIFLLTDGLPTQGAKAPSSNKVTGRQRLRHFERAVASLPAKVPVNVILFPMEGDPLAASAFWKLAVLTRGSFVAPAGDWP